MEFATLLDAMNQGSGFELYRLRIGQEIEYFDARANKLRPAQVREFRTKEVLVREIDTGEHWLIAYTAINLGGVDVTIRDNPQRGLSQHEVAIGDTVGFLDHEHRQRSGQIVRLNDKTVTLNADGQKWRVAYGLLHRVLNSSKAQTINGEIIKR